MLLHRFVIAVRAAIVRDALVAATGPLVVATSGGADSLALLHALHALCGRPGTAFPGVTLHVAHIAHGLRGVDGDADAEFVQACATQLQLGCTISRITADERAQWRGSVEASARTTRYARLRAIAASIGAERIALGHTLDDQAETILMHFLRGSGIDGLAGMRPRNGDLMRPLLDRRRAETEAYCADSDLIPRDDATNRDPRYLRNRVRHELIPLLETYQSQIRPTLARNAPLIAHDRDFLEAAADDAWQHVVVCDTPDVVTLDRRAVTTLHPAIRSRVLRRAALRVGSTKPDAHLDANSIVRLDRVLMDHSGEPRTVQLSTGAVAVCHGSTLRFVIEHDR